MAESSFIAARFIKGNLPADASEVEHIHISGYDYNLMIDTTVIPSVYNNNEAAQYPR